MMTDDGHERVAGTVELLEIASCVLRIAEHLGRSWLDLGWISFLMKIGCQDV